MGYLIYLETNWIIGAVMGQDPRANDLLNSNESDIHLVLPAVCLMEVISAFDRKRTERNKLKNEIEAQLQQITRSTDINDAQQLVGELTQAKLTNDRLLNELFKRLDNYLVRVMNRVELIPVSADVVQKCLQLVRETELDRDDALILASLLTHASSEKAARKAFLTGNYKDFSRERVRTLIRRTGIKQFTTTKRVLGWARDN